MSEADGVHWAKLLVNGQDHIEAAVVITLAVEKHDAAAGHLDAVVQCYKHSASGVGPHFHNIAAALRFVADRLVEEAARAGYVDTSVNTTELGKDGGTGQVLQ